MMTDVSIPARTLVASLLVLASAACGDPLADEQYEGDPLVRAYVSMRDANGQRLPSAGLVPLLVWASPPGAPISVVDAGDATSEQFATLFVDVLLAPPAEVRTLLDTTSSGEPELALAALSISDDPTLRLEPGRHQLDSPRLERAVAGYSRTHVVVFLSSPAVPGTAAHRLFGYEAPAGTYVARYAERDAAAIESALACERSATNHDEWLACPSRWPSIVPLRAPVSEGAVIVESETPLQLADLPRFE